MSKKHTVLGILVVLLLAAFVIEFGILPQSNLITCEDLERPQLLLFSPEVLEGLLFAVAACGLEKEHIYTIYDNSIGSMNRTFTNTETHYSHYVLYEEDFNEDFTIKFWLLDNTTQKIVDTKMIVLKQVWG